MIPARAARSGSQRLSLKDSGGRPSLRESRRAATFNLRRDTLIGLPLVGRALLKVEGRCDMQPQPVVDQTKVEQFVGKVLGDTSATLVTLLAAIGDRLGLFKELAASGPVTSADFASRTGINERYAREWLGGMATAGYIDYDSATWRFTLPPEHVPALAQETGPFFFGGVYEMLPAMAGVLDQVTRIIPSAAAECRSPPTMRTSGMAWSDSRWAGSRTCSRSSGFLPCPTCRRSSTRAHWWRMSAAGVGAASSRWRRRFPTRATSGTTCLSRQLTGRPTNAKAAGVADRVRFQQLDASDWAARAV